VAYVDSGTDIRDGSTLGIFSSLNYRLLPILDLEVGLRHDARFSDSEVFDTTKSQVFTSVFFGLSPKLSVRAGTQLVFGNEVSTATPTVDIVDSASEITPDGAFGGFDGNRFAYLIDANSFLATFGLSYFFNNTVSADSALTFIRTDAIGDIDYTRTLLSFEVKYNFQ